MTRRDTARDYIMPAPLCFGLKVTQVTSPLNFLVRTTSWPNLTAKGLGNMEEQMECLVSPLPLPQACISPNSTYQSGLALLQMDIDQKSSMSECVTIYKCFHNTVDPRTTWV